ncbi:hypothetical protein BDR03DRAFT_1017254 [Suillus americanus]|nr:hypothetical protein BDR03DRAFT_1017254 [Suillus americanus]
MPPCRLPLHLPPRPSQSDQSLKSPLKSSASAGSVWGSTPLAIASPPQTLSSQNTLTGNGACLQMSCFASCSTGSKAAQRTPTHLPTSAPSVAIEQQVTTPSCMPPLDLLPIVTPLLWDKWEELLEAVGVLDTFWDVPLGLCNGFHLGVSSSISSTFSLPVK